MSIELIERVDPIAVAYLASIPYTTYKQECLNDYAASNEKKPTENQMKSWYNGLNYFCRTVKDAKGIVKRFYNYSSKNPRGVCGRLFCHGSVQSIWGKYRGLLLRDTTTDIDMKNAHPVILRYICNKHSIACPNLEYYINHRDDCLAKFQNRDSGKLLYLKSTNKEQPIPANQYQSFPELKAYDKEMKSIQKQLICIPEYKELIDTVPEDKRDYNYNGSVINRILCFYENEILQHAIHIIRTEGIEIAVLMFDGLLIYGNFYDNSELLQKISDYVEEQMEGLNMEWCYKEHDTSITIPPDFKDTTIRLQQDIENAQTRFEENNWTTVSDRFEKYHCKINNKGIFIKKDGIKIVPMSKTHLITTYENMIYVDMYINSEGNPVVKESNFIHKWLKDNPRQLTYDDIGCYPNPKLCPKNIFNTWIPFAMESVTEWTHHQDGLDIIRSHIHILCGNEKEVSDYFEKWIGQMILYPEVKTICPVLISEEGAGKGSLLQLMSKMLGPKKVFETSDPSRDVWGSFNGQMQDSFLVNLNELSKKDTIESEGKIKALITDSSLYINNKGVNQYQIDSHHRFLISTNVEDPIRTSDGDRRKLIIRSSDQLIPNKQYFNEFYELIENQDVVKTCYEYFKSLPDLDKFNKIPIPQTEYQKNLSQLSISSIERWIHSYVSDKNNPTRISTSELFHRFKEWAGIYGSKYDVEITLIAFGMKLKRLPLDGGLIPNNDRKNNGVSLNFQQILDSKCMRRIIA